MSSKKPWSPLVHRVYRRLCGHLGAPGVAARRFGVAVSGGRDSMLLLEILRDLAEPLALELHVLHAHHGPTDDPAQAAFRAAAQKLVAETAREFGLPFHHRVSHEALTSEESLRDFRLAFFKEVCARENLEEVFCGHHAQDLLETRLQRLIRGTGGQGVEAMSERGRPFLPCPPEELNAEAQARSLRFVEDPSNGDSRYFRNWLRHEWLPQLEAKSPGALRSFARSLEIWAEEGRSRDEQFPPEGLFIAPDKLHGPTYLRLNASEQKRVLAHLLRTLKNADYSRGQIEEIQKRLDNSQNEYTFKVAGLAFAVNSHVIHVSDAGNIASSEARLQSK